MSQFYITLPSDSSMTYYPNNTVARYTTKLAQRIHLDGDYEVGLCEIIYAKSWNNFSPGDMTMVCKTVDDMPYGSVKFVSGHYEDEKALLKSLNEHMQSNHCIVELSYDKNKQLISMEMRGQDVHKIYVSDEFKSYFGFDKNGPFTDGFHVAKNRFDMNSGLRLMFIYSDVASYSTVGDKQTPLLRVCNTRGDHGDSVRETFVRPHYIPVAHRDFETIDIHINTELGLPMPFEFGKTVVTLHFRRKHSFLEQA